MRFKCISTKKFLLNCKEKREKNLDPLFTSEHFKHFEKHIIISKESKKHFKYTKPFQQ